MGKGAVLPSFVDFQVPDNRSQQDDRRIDEEVALLLYPRLIEVEHDRIGRFVGVRDVGHKLRSDGIAAVRTTGIVEIDDAEFRSGFVGVQVIQKVVVSDRGQVVEFEVVEVHGEALLDLLADEAVHHGVGLAGTGRAEYYCRTKGIHRIDPAFVPCLAVVVTRTEVDRIFVLDQACFLHETFVFVVERVLAQPLLDQTSEP